MISYRRKYEILKQCCGQRKAWAILNQNKRYVFPIHSDLKLTDQEKKWLKQYGFFRTTEPVLCRYINKYSGKITQDWTTKWRNPRKNERVERKYLFELRLMQTKVEQV